MDAIISASHNLVTGDNSSLTTTKLYRVLTFSCRNPQCENCKKEVGQQKLEQQLN
jgi:hypothetical protein